MKLYQHKTSGGAEYLCDAFVVCPNGEKEGVFEGSQFIVRLDGEPELMVRDSMIAAAPELLEALRAILNEQGPSCKVNEDSQQWAMRKLNNCLYIARKAIAKAKGE